jgi:lipopolysaccharide export system protein LptA
MACSAILVVLVAMPIDAPAGATGPASAASAPAASELRIDADQGLEWQRREQVVIARGNATAVRGDLEVQAQELRALYRDRPDGKSEVFRVIANGSVRLSTPNQTAFGQHGTYDVINDHLLLTGGDRVKLVSNDSEITADRSLEYWPDSGRLVARGNAIAVQPGKEVHGETITGHFVKGADGTTQLSTAEAVNKVKVVTPSEVIYSDRGTYDAKSGIATVEGSVKIFRGNDRLDGCRGQINFNSGVSKLFACEQPETGTDRVRGRIQLKSGKGN